MIGVASPHTLPHLRPSACCRGVRVLFRGADATVGGGSWGVAYEVGVPRGVASCSSPNVAVSSQDLVGEGT
jgi:hypothetical protein